MKNLLLLLSIIFFTSCNTNYNNALKYLDTAIQLNSQEYLDNAKYEFDLIDESKKSEDKVIKLSKKITELQNRLDSISYVETEMKISKENKLLIQQIRQQKEKDESIKDDIKIEKLKYPNMIGKWRNDESNYLKILNGVVRIYKKNGTYYISRIFDKDNSESILKLRKSYDKREPNYYYTDGYGKSDYYIIDKNNGQLENWDKEGYLMTSMVFDNYKPIIKKLSNDFNKENAIGRDIFIFRFEYGLEDFKTVDGTNNKKWVTYYPKYDLTLTSNKQSNQIEDFKFGN